MLHPESLVMGAFRILCSVTPRKVCMSVLSCTRYEGTTQRTTPWVLYEHSTYVYLYLLGYFDTRRTYPFCDYNYLIY